MTISIARQRREVTLEVKCAKCISFSYVILKIKHIPHSCTLRVLLTQLPRKIMVMSLERRDVLAKTLNSKVIIKIMVPNVPRVAYEKRSCPSMLPI